MHRIKKSLCLRLKTGIGTRAEGTVSLIQVEHDEMLQVLKHKIYKTNQHTDGGRELTANTGAK